ncbi:MAG: DMT family transporter [Bacteroidales bacterium]|nr:DMT family transporter [Bacteroidales bacterium]
MYGLLAVATLTALSFTLTKTCLLYAKPLFIVSFRLITAGSILLILYNFFVRPRIRINRAHRHLFATIFFFGIYLAALLNIWSLQYLTSIKATFINNLGPFFAIVLSYFLLGERMTKKKWLGLTIGLIGIIPIFTVQPAPVNTSKAFFWSSFHIPEIVAMSSLLSYYYGWIAMRKLMQTKLYSPIYVSGICMFAGGILMAYTSLFFEGWEAIFNREKFLLFSGLLVLVSDISLFNTYAYLLKSYTVTFVSFGLLMAPAIGSIFGTLFLKEPFYYVYLIPLVTMPIGLYIFYKEEQRLQQDT